MKIQYSKTLSQVWGQPIFGHQGPQKSFCQNVLYLQQIGLKASLMEMPAIEKLTEKESAHPSQHQLDKLTKSGPSGALFSTGAAAGDEEERSEDAFKNNKSFNWHGFNAAEHFKFENLQQTLDLPI